MFVRRNASRLAALTVPLVLAAGSLAGCSDGEADPGPAPSTSASSPSPSQSESSPSEPVEPTLPAEAQGDDAEAAKAFVRHYYEMANYAQATGDVRGLKRLGLPSCAACDGLVSGIRKVYARGGKIEGGTLTLSRVRSSKYGRADEQPHAYAISVEYRNEAQVISQAGPLNERFPASRAAAKFMVVRDVDDWHVAKWEPAS